MIIDWTHFTPWASLAGGILLGVASAMFLLVNGRILGISGIVGGLLHAVRGDRAWRITFVLGMLAAPLCAGLWMPPAWLQPPQIDATYGIVLVAGLLVGYGTRLGSGCTSGHGVCGLSRLSPRSAVATACFMASGFATVFVVRHLLGMGSP
jgi:uncharacterized membrane protein YedE/YeeE